LGLRAGTLFPLYVVPGLAARTNLLPNPKAPSQRAGKYLFGGQSDTPCRERVPTLLHVP
jgi:hypothetical protein